MEFWLSWMGTWVKETVATAEGPFLGKESMVVVLEVVLTGGAGLKSLKCHI